jgi:hypothetical protein
MSEMESEDSIGIILFYSGNRHTVPGIICVMEIARYT